MGTGVSSRNQGVVLLKSVLGALKQIQGLFLSTVTQADVPPSSPSHVPFTRFVALIYLRGVICICLMHKAGILSVCTSVEASR